MPDAARLCPACNGAMIAHTVRNLRLDICSACGGVWFDAGEFGRVNRLGSRAVDSVMAEEPPDLKVAPAPAVIQHCPVDGAALNRYTFAASTAVMLAGCPQCAGIYLSHDDLLKLDARDRQLENRGGAHLTEDEALSVAQLDGQVMYDRYSSNMAQYNWDQLMTPVMFS
ncbi:MAG: TFIIB-type zinc ribbon-containing protein [Fimbriimonadaceae bacterium]